MLKRISHWLDPILLIGLFISIAMGVVMVLSGNDTLSGLTIGLLSTIVTLLIDIVARIQKAENSFLTGNQETLANFERMTERTIASLQGVDVRLFERSEDFWIYLQRRILNAKRSLDVTHFGLATPSTEGTISQGYYDTFSKIVREGKIKIRRIVIVRDRAQLDWVRQMINEFSGYPFFVGCYSRPSPSIPMFNMVIIDGEEVCLSGGEKIPAFDSKTISLKHPLFIQLMQEHFDTLWRDSMRLNERGIRDDLLTQLDN